MTVMGDRNVKNQLMKREWHLIETEEQSLRKHGIVLPVCVLFYTY